MKEATHKDLEQWEMCVNSGVNSADLSERVTLMQILNVLKGPVKVCVYVGRCWDLGKSL